MDATYSIVLISLRRPVQSALEALLGGSYRVISMSQAAHVIEHFRQFGCRTRAVIVDASRAEPIMQTVLNQLPSLVWPYMPPLVVVDGHLHASVRTLAVSDTATMGESIRAAIDTYALNQHRLFHALPATVTAAALERSASLLMQYRQWFQSMPYYPVSKPWRSDGPPPSLSGAPGAPAPMAVVRSLVALFEDDTGIFLPPARLMKPHTLVNPSAADVAAYTASVSEPSALILRVPAVTDALLGAIAQIHRRIVVGHAPWDIVLVSDVGAHSARRQPGVHAWLDASVSAERLTAVTQYLAVARYGSAVLPNMLNRLKSQWLPFRFRRHVFLDKIRLGEAVSVSMVQNLFPEWSITAQDLAEFDPQAPDASLFALMCIKFKSHPNSPHYQANNRQGNA